MINDEGLALIRVFEGLKLKAYQDSVGVWTIGYGDTKHAKPGMQISLEKADQYLYEDISVALEAVKELVKVKLTDNQLAALTSFVFNLGVGNFKKSTLLRKLNDKDYVGAANEFDKWINAGGKPLEGLKRRRAAEKRLFLA